MKNNTAILRQNSASTYFQQLRSMFSQDSSHPIIDTIAINLVSSIAAHGTTCVGLFQTSAIPSLFNLVYFLDTYGIKLEQHFRDQRDGIYVLVALKPDQRSQYAGAVVQERDLLMERLNVLANREAVLQDVYMGRR